MRNRESRAMWVLFTTLLIGCGNGDVSQSTGTLRITVGSAVELPCIVGGMGNNRNFSGWSLSCRGTELTLHCAGKSEPLSAICRTASAREQAADVPASITRVDAKREDPDLDPDKGASAKPMPKPSAKPMPQASSTPAQGNGNPSGSALTCTITVTQTGLSLNCPALGLTCSGTTSGQNQFTITCSSSGGQIPGVSSSPGASGGTPAPIVSPNPNASGGPNLLTSCKTLSGGLSPTQTCSMKTQ